MQQHAREDEFTADRTLSEAAVAPGNRQGSVAGAAAAEAQRLLRGARWAPCIAPSLIATPLVAVMWRSDATTSTVLLASVAAAAATLAFGLSFIPMGRARTIARGRVADEGGADGAIPGDSGGITILVGILFSIAAILAIGFGVALAAERADTTGIAYGLLAGGLGGGTLLAVPAFLRLQTLW